MMSNRTVAMRTAFFEALKVIDYPTPFSSTRTGATSRRRLACSQLEYNQRIFENVNFRSKSPSEYLIICLFCLVEHFWWFLEVPTFECPKLQ